jgi:hypothetical protein
MKHCYTGLLQRCCSVLVREVLDECVAFSENGRNVQPSLRKSFSHTRDGLGKIEYLDWAKQRFAGVAAPVMTLSTDQTIFNERYREAGGRKPPDGGHTAHPATYDDHVEVFTSLHLPSFPCSARAALWVGLTCRLTPDRLVASERSPDTSQ